MIQERKQEYLKICLYQGNSPLWKIPNLFQH